MKKYDIKDTESRVIGTIEESDSIYPISNPDLLERIGLWIVKRSTDVAPLIGGIIGFFLGFSSVGIGGGLLFSVAGALIFFGVFEMVGFLFGFAIRIIFYLVLPICFFIWIVVSLWGVK